MRPIIVHEYHGQRWVDPVWYGADHDQNQTKPALEVPKVVDAQNRGSPDSGSPFGGGRD